MDRALLFSHSTMTSCFACVGFVWKDCLEIPNLVARTLGLQREQLRVSHTDSIPSDEDYDAGFILNDADSIPSNAGSISSHANSIPGDTNSSRCDTNSVTAVTLFEHCRDVVESIPSDEDYDAGSILNDADSIPSDAGSISNHAALTLFEHCRDAATAVRLHCERVRFNKSLCRLLADTYSRYLHSTFDFTDTNECQTVLAELRRVISCGEMLVQQWTDKDSWLSVVSSSDSASIKERVVLHLNEFLFCVEVLRLIASNRAVPEGTSLIPLDLSTPDVEEASQRDIESLRSAVESYKTTSYPQGHVTKLAEYVLEKLRATNSDPGHLHLIEYDDVELGTFLGKGTFGAVFKSQFLGEKAAAKVFTASRPTQVNTVQKEAKLQASLQHPNVVQFIGYAATESQHIIVSELMSKDLRSYLDETVHTGQTRPPLSLLLAVDIMHQIAEPMKYLHEKGMMHSDLKATNILINVVERKELCVSPSVQVKLTDFGFSKLNLVNSRFTSLQTGATLWRAPEC